MTLLANGNVQYRSAQDYSGTDSFTYTVRDASGAVSNTATVTFNVAADNDPIILDLGAPGISLTSAHDNPVSFDLDADGIKELLGWTAGQDGILALDLNGSGAIENGREIFSPAFGAGGFGDALAALASLDSNGDGLIDAHDNAFPDILVWTDVNHDGRSAPDELGHLADHDIVSIDLNAQSVDYELDDQHVFAQGHFTLATGQTRDYIAIELDQAVVAATPVAGVAGAAGPPSAAQVTANDGTQPPGSASGDRIVSSPLDETLTGHDGNDAFVFASHFGNDVVAEFQPGIDFVEIDHTIFADVTALLDATQDVNGGAVVGVDEHDFDHLP